MSQHTSQTGRSRGVSQSDRSDASEEFVLLSKGSHPNSPRSDVVSIDHPSAPFSGSRSGTSAGIGQATTHRARFAEPRNDFNVAGRSVSRSSQPVTDKVNTYDTSPSSFENVHGLPGRNPSEWNQPANEFNAHAEFRAWSSQQMTTSHHSNDPASSGNLSSQNSGRVGYHDGVHRDQAYPGMAYSRPDVNSRIHRKRSYATHTRQTQTHSGQAYEGQVHPSGQFPASGQFPHSGLFHPSGQFHPSRQLHPSGQSYPGGQSHRGGQFNHSGLFHPVSQANPGGQFPHSGLFHPSGHSNHSVLFQPGNLSRSGLQSYPLGNSHFSGQSNPSGQFNPGGQSHSGVRSDFSGQLPLSGHTQSGLGSLRPETSDHHREIVQPRPTRAREEVEQDIRRRVSPIAHLPPPSEREPFPPYVDNFLQSLAPHERSIRSIQAKIDEQEESYKALQEELAKANVELRGGNAKEINARHVKLLHDYNEIKDVGMGLLALIAEGRGVRVREVMEEFGVGEED